MESTQIVSKRRAQTQDRLLQAAYEVFAAHGFAGSSIEMITEAAGYTRGAFYSNFSSKEELFVALANRELSRRTEAVASAIAHLQQVPREDEKISSTLVAQMIASALGAPEEERHWQIMLTEFRLFAWHHPQQAAGFRQLYTHYVQSISDFLKPSLDRFGIRYAVEPDVANRVLVSSFIEAIGDALTDPEREFTQAWQEQLTWYTTLVNHLLIFDES